MSVDLNRGDCGAVSHTANINKFSSQFYEACLFQSELPNVSGVSKRIVDALVVRILATGYPELSFESIAEDLSMTRRTVQRYLKNEGESFSALRDQVRCHYAVKLLLEDCRQIEHIAEALGFSDRTSFTNAFKRWLGVSPRALKELHNIVLHSQQKKNS